MKVSQKIFKIALIRKPNKIYLLLNTNKLQVITGHWPFFAPLHSVNLDPFVYRRIGGVEKS